MLSQKYTRRGFLRIFFDRPTRCVWRATPHTRRGTTVSKCAAGHRLVGPYTTRHRWSARSTPAKASPEACSTTRALCAAGCVMTTAVTQPSPNAQPDADSRVHTRQDTDGRPEVHPRRHPRGLFDHPRAMCGAPSHDYRRDTAVTGRADGRRLAGPGTTRHRRSTRNTPARAAPDAFSTTRALCAARGVVAPAVTQPSPIAHTDADSRVLRTEAEVRGQKNARDGLP